MKLLKLVLTGAALCSFQALAAHDVATSDTGAAVPAQSGYRCVVSVQNLYKRLTPAGSGEMPVISLAQAKKDASCPHVTPKILGAYKKRAELRRIQVAQMNIGGTTVGGIQYPGGYSAGGVTIGGTTVNPNGSVSVGGISIGGTSMGGVTTGGNSFGGITITSPRH